MTNNLDRAAIQRSLTAGRPMTPNYLPNGRRDEVSPVPARMPLTPPPKQSNSRRRNADSRRPRPNNHCLRPSRWLRLSCTCLVCGTEYVLVGDDSSGCSPSQRTYSLALMHCYFLLDDIDPSPPLSSWHPQFTHHSGHTQCSSGTSQELQTTPGAAFVAANRLLIRPFPRPFVGAARLAAVWPPRPVGSSGGQPQPPPGWPHSLIVDGFRTRMGLACSSRSGSIQMRRHVACYATLRRIDFLRQ